MEAETPTNPSNENLLVTPKTATAMSNVTYEDVTRLPVPDNEPEAPKRNVLQPPVQRQNHQQPSGPSEEQKAAWSSPLFPPSAQALRQVQPQSAANPLDSALAKLTDIELPTPQNLFPGNQPSATERSEAFLKGGVDGDVYLQQGLQKPVSPYEIKAGSIIPAALIIGLNSDLPGQIVGQVTELVYDTVTGHYLLIPQGTKIFGRYNSDVDYAQNRLQIVWDRLIMPNGNSIGLEAMVGTDKTGVAGLQDGVDYHISSVVGAILPSSIIGAAAQQAASVGSEIVGRQLDVQPTITVRPGFKLNILVNTDIILEPYR